MQYHSHESNSQIQSERADQSNITFIPLSSAIDTFAPYNCVSSLLNGFIKSSTPIANENIGVLIRDPVSRQPFIVVARSIGGNIGGGFFYN